MVEKKIVESRTKAQTLIQAGQIFIGGKKILKSGEQHDPNENIVSKYIDHQWVSRGALKLLYAIDHFKINVANFKCLDIGASTGGFTEVLLSRKAKKIYSVDVGTNQLHDKLMDNPKVLNLSKTNAKFLTKNIITDSINIIVCDVSFISMKKVIYPSLSFLEKKSGIIIALIKPQFELSKSEIKNNRNGVVTNKDIHQRICNDYKNWFTLTCGMKVVGIIPSPIKQIKGNIEFLIYVKKQL